MKTLQKMKTTKMITLSSISSILLLSGCLLSSSLLAQTVSSTNPQPTTNLNLINVPTFVPPPIVQTPSAQMSVSKNSEKKTWSATQANPNSVSSSLEKKSTTPTAAEQGLVDPNQQKLADWELRQTLNNETARQRGEVIPSPLPYNPVAKIPQYQGWLANWEKALTDSGVGLEKIKFEEGRLNFKQFSRWASNQLRYESNSISIESASK